MDYAWESTSQNLLFDFSSVIYWILNIENEQSQWTKGMLQLLEFSLSKLNNQSLKRNRTSRFKDVVKI